MDLEIRMFKDETKEDILESSDIFLRTPKGK